MTIQELKSKLSIPVIASPMFLVSGVDLVVACCKNGVLGTFPALNGRSSEDFENMLIQINQELDLFRRETGIEPAPYGVNLIVNKTNPRLIPDLTLCVKYKVPVVITSLGAVKEVVDAVHSYGGLIFHDIIKKRHAEKAIEAGVDGIIAVCAGAGGHAGTSNVFALVDEIRSFYKGTLILAGAINSGKQILAAETIGADFAYMGTRFIATDESLASQEYKEMLVQTSIEDVIYTAAVSGVSANFLKPSIEQAQVDLNTEKKEDFSELNASNAKAWKDVWSAGHGVAGIHSVETVESLINQLKHEYFHTMDQLIDKKNKIHF